MKPYLFPLLVVGLALAAPAQQDPEDPNTVVFVPLRESGEGAPGKKTRDDFVVLTDVGARDPYNEVVTVLRARGVKDVVRFKPGKIKQAFTKLAKMRPGFVVVVVKPETLDVNFHFDFLERAARLDDDPFVDFAFGYITGKTAEEAVAFAQGIVKAAKGRLPKAICEFGPSTRPSPMTSPVSHKWAKGWKTRRFYHAYDADSVVAELGKLEKVGVLRASGHGMPDGVDHGLKGSELRESGLDLYPSLYFSGPCYCGVPGGWFRSSGGRVTRENVAPEDSFVLALIHAKVTGAFAGLDPDRGETNSHELEHVLLTGEPLGMASKSTYDDVVVAYRRPELKLPKYEVGKRDPHRDIGDTMIAGGACRALFGDPTFAPLDAAGEDPFAVKAKWAGKSLRVRWESSGDLGAFWTPVDVFRAGGGWTHRMRFRIEVPLKKARQLKSFAVRSVTKDGRELKYHYPTAAVEVWGGVARIHGLIVFPTENPQDRALWGGKEYKAEFVFGM